MHPLLKTGTEKTKPGSLGSLSHLDTCSCSLQGRSLSRWKEFQGNSFFLNLLKFFSPFLDARSFFLIYLRNRMTTISLNVSRHARHPHYGEYSIIGYDHNIFKRHTPWKTTSCDEYSTNGYDQDVVKLLALSKRLSLRRVI